MSRRIQGVRIEGRHSDPYMQLDHNGNVESFMQSIDGYAYHHGGRVHAQFQAGEFYLEAANRCDDPNMALEALDKAANCWQNTIDIQASKEPVIDHLAGRAKLRLAYGDVYRWNAVCPEVLPSQAVKESTYGGLLEVAREHVAAFAATADDDRRSDGKTSRLAGHIAEIETLLLCERFSLRLGDSSWQALPATFAEDRGRSRYLENREAWDITVMTQLDEHCWPTQQYKVQVKSTRSHQRKAPYADGIAVVYVREDLALKNGGSPNRILPVGAIAQECLREYDGEAKPADIFVLNQREGQLLDILG